MRRKRVQRPGFFCLLYVCVCEPVGTGAKSQSSASLFFFVRSFFLSQPRETPRALKINNLGSPFTLLGNKRSCTAHHQQRTIHTQLCNWFNVGMLHTNWKIGWKSGSMREKKGSILPFTSLTCRVTNKKQPLYISMCVSYFEGLIPFPSDMMNPGVGHVLKRSTSSFFSFFFSYIIFFFRKFLLLCFYPILLSLCFHQIRLSLSLYLPAFAALLFYLFNVFPSASSKRTVGTCPNG